MTEQVLVVPTDRLDALGRFDGFSDDRRYFDALKVASFVDRAPAEGDESRRQVIPYVVIRTARGVFSYVRTGAGREARLHGRRSIGVGGHVNPSDLPEGLAALAAAPLETLAAAARRELAEETVGLDGAPLGWLGFLRDESAPVARVHLGVVYLADPAHGDVALTDEGAMADARWLRWTELAADRDAYEGWSRLVIGHMAGSGR
jgi:predicted NUDIX family phosphoesterase